MMVIYGKVFQAARARIHKKRFRSQPVPHHEDQQPQQQQSDVDAGVEPEQAIISNRITVLMLYPHGVHL